MFKAGQQDAPDTRNDAYLGREPRTHKALSAACKFRSEWRVLTNAVKLRIVKFTPPTNKAKFQFAITNMNE